MSVEARPAYPATLRQEVVDEGRIGGIAALASTDVKARRSAAGARIERRKTRPLAYPAAVGARSSA